MNYFEAIEDSRKFHAIVQRMEFALSNDPGNRQLMLGIGSAKRRAYESDRYLESIASINQIDLIKYKISNREDNYAASALTDSISTFQASITGIVDFMKNGSKERARVPAYIRELSTLNFGYSYSGSLGVVLTIPNDMDLISSTFDGVTDVFQEFLEVQSTHAAVDASRHLGSAVIGQLYQWVKNNYHWKNEVDYIWRRSDGTLRGQNITVSTFERIDGIFSEASDIEANQIRINGILVGIDLEIGTFHIVEPNGESFKGSLGDEFSKDPTVVGKSYIATIKENINRQVATGQVKKSYQLLAIQKNE